MTTKTAATSAKRTRTSSKSAPTGAAAKPAEASSAESAADVVDAQLAKYRSMRDFHITQEPAGGARDGTKVTLPFCIQKHAASHLHYDFRLGWNGVLKSWAVAKGPSYFVGDKRLAVQVEDHPMEYGGFEGIIPAGQYGGGTVMLWDQGTWEPQPRATPTWTPAFATAIAQVHPLRHQDAWQMGAHPHGREGRSPSANRTGSSSRNTTTSSGPAPPTHPLRILNPNSVVTGRVPSKRSQAAKTTSGTPRKPPATGQGLVPPGQESRRACSRN